MEIYNDEYEDKYYMSTKAGDSNWFRIMKERKKEEKRLISEKIKAKGEYITPEEFEHEIYQNFIEKTKADPSKKKYDDYDAEKLYYYMLTLRNYYADSIYNFYKIYDCEKIRNLSPFILSEISGNKLEFDEINYDKKISEQNKEKLLYNEAELIKQRKKFYSYQTHHERSIQSLFNKKRVFQILQQRGLEANLMTEMVNQGFFIELPIQDTKQIKKIISVEDEKIIDNFYQFPIICEIIEESHKKIKDLKERREFLIKCRKTKESLIKLKYMLSSNNTPIRNFYLYSDSSYTKTLKRVIDNSLKQLNKIIDKAELAEIHDYYNGVDIFKI